MAEKLKGLLDSAREKIGGLLGGFNEYHDAFNDRAYSLLGNAPQQFNAGAAAGTAGSVGDAAYLARYPEYMLEGSMPDPRTVPGTSDYIAAQAGVPAPQGFLENAAWLAGQVIAPGPGEIGAGAAGLGKLAMFLGAKAKTAMPDLLNMAQEMEKAGATADDIWLATGQRGQPWFRGADGQWKFWISDKNAEYTPGKVVEAAKAEHKAMLDEAEAASMMRHQMDRAGLSVGEAKDWFRQTFGREPPEGAGQWLRNFDADTLTKRYLDLEARAEPSYGNITTRSRPDAKCNTIIYRFRRFENYKLPGINNTN